jgi:hypothetical protein
MQQCQTNPEAHPERGQKKDEGPKSRADKSKMRTFHAILKCIQIDVPGSISTRVARRLPNCCLRAEAAGRAGPAGTPSTFSLELSQAIRSNTDMRQGCNDMRLAPSLSLHRSPLEVSAWPGTDQLRVRPRSMITRLGDLSRNVHESQ